VPSSSYNIVSNDSDCLDNDPTHTTSVSYGESSGYRTCFFAPLSSNGRTFGYCTNGVWGQSSTCYPNSESCSARCLPESTCASYTAAQCGYGNDNFGEQVGSFSSPCGPSTATQSCTVGTGNCARTGSQTRTCSTGDSWGVWGSWSACSVSAGAPGTCSSLGDNCGSDDSDGCGGTLNCGPDSRTSSCSVGTGNCARSGTQTQYCSGGTWGGAWTACNAVAGSPGTCSSMGGYVCGSSDSDGCGGTINCGANSNSQGCSVGTGSCARSGTQTQYCSGGFWGGWGSCSVSPGAPGTCSSLGYACGSSMSDGCGGNLNCGADSQSQGCSAGSGNCLHSGGTQTKSCNSGTWASNWSSCSVSAYSNATCAYMGYVCGSSLPDGCGGTLYICGNSTESQGCTVGTGSCQRTGTQSASCNGSGQWGSWGSCSVSPGSPGTCSSLGYACGSSMGDGCGGSLNCGANSRTSRTCYCSNYSANGYYSDTCVGGQWSNGSTCLPSGHPKCN
jgi:loricrin